MKHSLLFLAFLMAPGLFAQAQDVKTYTWDANPKFSEVPSEFSNYPAVVIKDERLMEVSEIVRKSYVVKHVVIKIQQYEGIDLYNKVSIEKQFVKDYLDIQARVIKPDGKIMLLSKDRIVTHDNSKDRQFVFEGVETGDILEYYYVIKDYPEISDAEYFQRAIPVMEARFQLKNFKLGVSHIDAYNGMKEEYTRGYKVYVARNLPAFKDEMNAANRANLAKLYYKFDGIINYTWMVYYRSLNFYAEGKSAKSMIQDFVESLKLDDVSAPLDERLKKMDIYLKENIKIDQQDNYKRIFETKKMTPSMVLNLYKDVLDYLKVPYHFVVSTDKFTDKFDSENVVPAALTEIMIYIPETKKYLSPFHYYMPYGMPSAVSVNNNGISYYMVDGDVRYEFLKIGNVPMQDNIESSSSEITLGDDMETVAVNKENSFTGYSAYYYREMLKSVPQDKVKIWLKEIVSDGVDSDISNYALENTGYRFNYENDKPLTFKTALDVKDAWVENAGNTYLVTLGKVLGKQNNLYQETERKFAIDLSYPKKYIHHIVFNIPKGYKAKGTNSLHFDQELKDEKGEIIGKFQSVAKIDGDKVIVDIEEFYNFTHLEKDRYNDYRNLLNTASDFTKAVLILTKM